MQICIIFYCIYAVFFQGFFFSSFIFTSISKQTYKWQLHSLIVSASYSNSFPPKAAKSTQEQTEEPNKELEVLTQTFPVSWEIPPTIHSTQGVCKRCAGMPLLGLCSWWRVRDQCKIRWFSMFLQKQATWPFFCASICHRLTSPEFISRKKKKNLVKCLRLPFMYI